MSSLFARVLSFARRTRNGANVSDVKVNPGGGANVTAEHAGPAGEDAVPLPGDYAVAVPLPRGGGYVVVAYLDPKAGQTAAPGERRVYARNAAGESVVELWLKGDGSAVLSNAAGSFELAASGTVTINGVTIAPDGTITTPADVVFGPLAISAIAHKHTSALPGVPTGPALP